MRNKCLVGEINWVRVIMKCYDPRGKEIKNQIKLGGLYLV